MNTRNRLEQKGPSYFQINRGLLRKLGDEIPDNQDKNGNTPKYQYVFKDISNVSRTTSPTMILLTCDEFGHVLKFSKITAYYTDNEFAKPASYAVLTDEIGYDKNDYPKHIERYKLTINPEFKIEQIHEDDYSFS